MAKRGSAFEIIVLRRQIVGRSRHPYSLHHDLRFEAMYPGKRKSKNGNVYWELRRNRSDLDKARRL